MRLPLLFILFLPLAEIAGFVVVGRMIGVLPVLGLVLAGGVIGLFLLRLQGADALRKLTAESRAGRDAGRSLVHAALIVVAAFLLIVPGFISDIFGLLLFVPFVRDFVWSIAKPRVTVFGGGPGFSSRGPDGGPTPDRGRGGQVIDLDPQDFERRDDEPKR